MIRTIRRTVIVIAVVLQCWVGGAAALADETRPVLPHITTMALTDDGRYLAAASSRGWLMIWDLATGKTVRSFKAHDDDIYAIRFAADDKLLLSGSDDYTAKVWSVPALKNIRTIHTLGKVTSGDVSKDGQTLVLGLWDGTLQKWNIPNGTLTKSIQGHFFGRVILNITPSGKQIVSGSSDQMIHVWDIDSLDMKYSLKSGVQGDKAHLGSIYGAQFLDENRALSLASRGTTSLTHLILWDLRTGRPLKSAEGTASIAGLSFTRDKSRFAYVEGGKRMRRAVIFDLHDWHELKYLDPGVLVRDVAFGPDGRWAITGTENGRVVFWDIANHRQLISIWCDFDRACGIETPNGVQVSGDQATHLLRKALSDFVQAVPQ